MKKVAMLLCVAAAASAVSFEIFKNKNMASKILHGPRQIEHDSPEDVNSYVDMYAQNKHKRNLHEGPLQQDKYGDILHHQLVHITKGFNTRTDKKKQDLLRKDGKETSRRMQDMSPRKYRRIGIAERRRRRRERRRERRRRRRERRKRRRHRWHQYSDEEEESHEKNEINNPTESNKQTTPTPICNEEYCAEENNNNNNTGDSEPPECEVQDELGNCVIKHEKKEEENKKKETETDEEKEKEKNKNNETQQEEHNRHCVGDNCERYEEKKNETCYGIDGMPIHICEEEEQDNKNEEEHDHTTSASPPSEKSQDTGENLNILLKLFNNQNNRHNEKKTTYPKQQKLSSPICFVLGSIRIC